MDSCVSMVLHCQESAQLIKLQIYQRNNREKDFYLKTEGKKKKQQNQHLFQFNQRRQALSTFHSSSAHFPMTVSCDLLKIASPITSLSVSYFLRLLNEEANTLVKMLLKHQLTRDVWMQFQYFALFIRFRGRQKKKLVSYQTKFFLK